MGEGRRAPRAARRNLRFTVSMPQRPPPDLGRTFCDLIMKGGITSGVVYPSAVAGLAERYRLRNIGGASAGAIAALEAGKRSLELGREVTLAEVLGV